MCWLLCRREAELLSRAVMMEAKNWRGHWSLGEMGLDDAIVNNCHWSLGEMGLDDAIVNNCDVERVGW